MQVSATKTRKGDRTPPPEFGMHCKHELPNYPIQKSQRVMAFIVSVDLQATPFVGVTGCQSSGRVASEGCMDSALIT